MGSGKFANKDVWVIFLRRANSDRYILPRYCSVDSGILYSNKVGHPPHWNIPVRDYLNDGLLHGWIGCIGENDLALFPLPPRSLA
ncbi:hypothetical protein X975_26293, partial [Stegodyphus mimosarum]